MQTTLGKMHCFGIGELTDFKCLYTIKKRTGGVFAIGSIIGHEPSHAGSIPFLATGNAGVTANADIQINDQGQLGHDYFLLPAK
jgi:hypothetical protein